MKNLFGSLAVVSVLLFGSQAAIAGNSTYDCTSTHFVPTSGSSDLGAAVTNHANQFMNSRQIWDAAEVEVTVHPLRNLNSGGVGEVIQFYILSCYIPKAAS